MIRNEIIETWEIFLNIEKKVHIHDTVSKLNKEFIEYYGKDQYLASLKSSIGESRNLEYFRINGILYNILYEFENESLDQFKNALQKLNLRKEDYQIKMVQISERNLGVTGSTDILAFMINEISEDAVTILGRLNYGNI